MKLRAPYNFIPLAKDVFHPDWAEKISFDKPFKDGLSGVIDVTLTARSPIFVRNGLSKMVVTDDDRRSISQNDYNRFNHIKDSEGNLLFFIPGSSVKGMLRSTVEIISDGKFAQVENQSFGKRNLNDPNLQNVRCGWLQKENDAFCIYDHGKPIKIESGKLDSVFPEFKLTEFITNGNFKSDENKTASVKYNRLICARKFSKVHFVEEIEEACRKANLGGTLVLTGQQGRYKPYEQNKFKKGKHHEFLIPDVSKPIKYLLDNETIQAFTTIHSNSTDWTGLWYRRFEDGYKIPVFFITKDSKVASIGLSRMYKYPYEKSVHGAIPEEHFDVRPDLAECMFGYSRQLAGELVALKGRVQVGHFFATGCSGEESPHKLILGTPHPSYYPLYVQDGKTWDEAVEVNGRKFYPIRKENVTEQLPKDDKVVVEENGIKKLSKSAIAMCPLAAGTVFTGKIRFFNLKPFELGALVSALTFFNKPGLYHSIGMGKPLGYGKTEVTVNKIVCIRNVEPDKDVLMTADKCIGMFKCDERFADWDESEVAKELFAMASENESVDSYMVMTTDAKTDEFRLLKESNTKGLPAFTKVTKGSICPGRYKAEVISSKRTKKDGKEFEKYGVALLDKPDIILTSKNFPLSNGKSLYGIGDKVKINVVDGEYGLWINYMEKLQ